MGINLIDHIGFDDLEKVVAHKPRWILLNPLNVKLLLLLRQWICRARLSGHAGTIYQEFSNYSVLNLLWDSQCSPGRGYSCADP